MSRQTGVFSAAVAVGVALFLLVFPSPRTPASALTDSNLAAQPSGGQSESVLPSSGPPAAKATGSWSHGISFDQFTRKVEQRAAVPPVPTSRPTTVPATPVVSSGPIQDVAP